MNQIYPELDQLINEMADGDKEFKKELTFAIHRGLLELKEVYAQGVLEKSEVKLQQIRHKLKPTLTMFELFQITDELQKGKEIIENEGFEGVSFSSHYQNLLRKVEHAIECVFALTL